MGWLFCFQVVDFFLLLLLFASIFAFLILLTGSIDFFLESWIGFVYVFSSPFMNEF